MSTAAPSDDELILSWRIRGLIYWMVNMNSNKWMVNIFTFCFRSFSCSIRSVLLRHYTDIDTDYTPSCRCLCFRLMGQSSNEYWFKRFGEENNRVLIIMNIVAKQTAKIRHYYWSNAVVFCTVCYRNCYSQQSFNIVSLLYMLPAKYVICLLYTSRCV